MKIAKIIALVVVLIFVILFFIGFFISEKATLINNTENKKIAVFVDKEINNPENYEQVKIATVQVEPSTGDLILSKIVDDPFNIKRLEEALSEIRKRSGLKLTIEDYEIINNEKVLVMKEIGILKTDADYIHAVRETLSMEFGFKAEIEK